MWDDTDLAGELIVLDSPCEGILAEIMGQQPRCMHTYVHVNVYKYKHHVCKYFI